MDKRKAPVPPYPEQSKRLPPSAGPGTPKRPDILDLTGSESKPKGKANSISNANSGSKTLKSKKRQSSRKSQAPESSQNPNRHKVQRRPTDHQPGLESVRRAGEKTTIFKEAARTMLPEGVVWKEVRPDVRQTMLAGIKYDAAMDWVGSDRAAYGHFRQPQLVNMLVSMMYWRRLDSTPWAKYVPEAYYAMVDERLDRHLQRNEVPSSWGRLDDHIKYDDEDADSSEDDLENDPDYQPPADSPGGSPLSSSSSEEDGEGGEEQGDSEGESNMDDEPPVPKPMSPVKRTRSADDNSTAVPNKPAKRQRQNASSGRQDSSEPRGTQDTPAKPRSRNPSVLASKAYDDLTVEELTSVEVPGDGDSSWRIHGVLVQYASSSKNSSCQTPGFPEYEIHKYAYDLVRARWDRDAYQKILDSKPWETMFDGRIHVLYFHEWNDLDAGAHKLLNKFVGYMRKHAGAFWERGHCVVGLT
ncbi:uncharacterized protein IUM83_14598 [Phytophthora cinnamomi]|uniref:uncharacterized protein n=1 Tax=Phytophthora cinnamomi TaxID=4785 RepID=UPI00355A9243|nr:hypothetical protein IUM83_14598 [Phytophthora cinnamomi]